MSRPLIVVESPAKARTISRILGKDYVVESSIGHIRDLPSKPAEIPPAQRKKSWARIGVDIENGFQPLYVVPSEKRTQVSKLKALLKEAKMLYLATDEDREGEAIAWHLVEVLQPKVPVKRMVFHEITERAVTEALKHPRDIDRRLVDAQEARRVLDRLYGYEVSPVLWRKIRPRLSAGRVQSVAIRLIVEREQQRRAFASAAYWGVQATLAAADAQNGREVLAELQEVAGRRVAQGRHFDAATGELSASAGKENVLPVSEPLAQALAQRLLDQTFRVVEVEEKPFTQRPYPPFITSTLQQEAGRKLGFAAQRTMRTAQRLYERGYITYMRTDATTLSQEALSAARRQVEALYGAEYLPASPRVYTKKVKGAQEAHEAIRPAGDTFRTPDQLRGELDADEQRLYDLIWKRTMASQMKDAVGKRTQVRFAVPVDAALSTAAGADITGEAIFSASGRVIHFPGFMRAYVEGSDDPEAELENKERILPALSTGDAFSARSLDAQAHKTQPPARYTEASLVKELEVRGIGRPSTYASIIQTIQDRGYVWKQGSALVPTLTAFAVVKLLAAHFEELVDYAFTSRMEDDLDAISDGAKTARPWLEAFYFGAEGRAPLAAEEKAVPGAARRTLAEVGLKGLIGTGVEDIDPRVICSLSVGKNEEGVAITARVGRYGPYLQVGDSDQRASIPDDTPLDLLNGAEALRLIRETGAATRVLGSDPQTGKPVFLKNGSYGPYVQLGEPELTPKGNVKRGSKPKMASLWPAMVPAEVTLVEALDLLSFPRVLGRHPEHGTDVTVQDGKFGPYLRVETAGGSAATRSLESHEQLKTLTLPQALEILKQPKPRGRTRGEPAALAELGSSEVTGKPLQVKAGRFGPYVTDGQVNATIPRGRDPQKITREEALELIAAREQRIRDQGADPRAAKPPSRRPRRSKATPTKRRR